MLDIPESFQADMDKLLRIADRFEELTDYLEAQYQDIEVFETVHSEMIERWN